MCVPYYRAVSLVTGYVGILIGLFHKILFGGSVSRQKASVHVRVTHLGVSPPKANLEAASLDS